VLPPHVTVPYTSTLELLQDGAGAHCPATDPRILANLKDLEDNGILSPGKISFYSQPSNSPDLNILDLGFFNALQSAYYGSSPTNSIEIIQCVQRAFDAYPANKINRLWVTLQSIYNCVLECQGDNNYSLPHMNKELMEREGTLPHNMSLSKGAMEVVFDEQVSDSDDSSQASFGSEGDRILAEEMADRASMAAGERGTQVSDDDNSIASGNASNWSMSTEEEVIFRKVEADLEAELKAMEGDSDEEEASTNSDYSLSPEELAVYEATEAEMLEAGTL
jgi:hypothetical protein